MAYGRKSTAMATELARILVDQGHTADIVDPAVLTVPMLERAYHHYPPGDAPEWMERLANRLKLGDAFITVCGEYTHGPASVYHGRPAGICTYSPGPWGGRMAAAHLRSVLPELGMVSIPTLLSLATDPDAVKTHAGKFLTELETYATKLA